jgi:hypothetical protein
MIMHICDVDFTLARPALLPLLAAFFNCVVGPSLLPKTFPLVDPALAVHLLLLANFSMWLHFIWNASQHSFFAAQVSIAMRQAEL